MKSLMDTGAKILVTTQSGSVYEIQDGYWRKNRGSINKTWAMHCMVEDVYQIYYEEGEAAAWKAAHDAEKLPLTVGLNMYIYSKDESYVSTRIVSIEEVPAK